MPEPLDPAEVVRVCLETPSDAGWHAFVRCFQPDIVASVARVARSYRRSDAATIDDLVQEAYVRICHNGTRLLHILRGLESGAIRAYVRRVAETVARDHFRAALAQKRGGDAESVTLELEPPANLAAADDLVLLNEVEDWLDRSVERSRDAAIYRLIRIQGFSAREVAELPNVGLTPKGVESCLARIDAMLRRALAARKREGGSRRIPLGGIDEEAR